MTRSSSSPCSAPAAAGPCFFETAVGVVLFVQARPRSSRARVDSLLGDSVKVLVRSAPVDGKANKELVETIAGWLGVAKSSVAVALGETSKRKRVLLRGVSAGALAAILKELA